MEPVLLRVAATRQRLLSTVSPAAVGGGSASQTGSVGALELMARLRACPELSLWSAWRRPEAFQDSAVLSAGAVLLVELAKLAVSGDGGGGGGH